MDFIKDDSYLDYINSIKLVKNKNLQQQIYKILLDLITKNILQPSTILLENKIALAFGVSKTPVREALKKLEIDELVKIIAQSKTYVLPINIEKVNSAFKIREALELLLVTEATNNAKEEDFKIFDFILEKQREALNNNNFDAFFENDVAFHFQIAKISNLPDVWNILQKVNLHINRIRCMPRNDYAWNNSVINEHRNILRAIKQRDIEIAKLQMTIHLSRVLNIIIHSQINTEIEVQNDVK